MIVFLENIIELAIIAGKFRGDKLSHSFDVDSLL